MAKAQRPCNRRCPNTAGGVAALSSGPIIAQSAMGSEHPGYQPPAGLKAKRAICGIFTQQAFFGEQAQDLR